MKSKIDTNSGNSFRDATVASAARSGVGNSTPVAAGRATRVRTPGRPTVGSTSTRAPLDQKQESRVELLERIVSTLESVVAANGQSVQVELEGLRAQMATMLEMMARSNATNAKAFTAVMHSAVPVVTAGGSASSSPVPRVMVKSELPPTPPRRIDAKVASPTASPQRNNPVPRGGPSPAASPREIPVPAERPSDIPEERVNPFLCG